MAFAVLVVGLGAVEFFDKTTERGYQPVTIIGILAVAAGPLTGYLVGEAGVLLAMMNLTAIPASFLVPWLSDRIGRRSPFLLGLSLCFIAGATVLVAAPGLAYGGALLAGVAQGGLFSLVMTLPLDFERTPKRVGALVAMMLGLVYTIAATSPFLLGAVRDLTG